MRYTGFHRAIGILHGENKQTWPICLCNQITADGLEETRSVYREHGIEPPSYTAMVIKAIALAIKQTAEQYPEINSFLTGVPGWRRIHLFKEISAGVAISRDEEGQDQAHLGVIDNPESTPLEEINQRLKGYSTKPVDDLGRMKNCHYIFRLPYPLQALVLWVGRTFPGLRRSFRGTFAITTVGKFGVDYQLTLPQASCLQFGFGSVRERPVVRDGRVVVARTFFLTLSFDRRLMNGKPCSLLMERIRHILESDQLRGELPATAPDTFLTSPAAIFGPPMTLRKTAV